MNLKYNLCIIIKILQIILILPKILALNKKRQNNDEINIYEFPTYNDEKNIYEFPTNNDEKNIYEFPTNNDEKNIYEFPTNNDEKDMYEFPTNDNEKNIYEFPTNNDEINIYEFPTNNEEKNIYEFPTNNEEKNIYEFPTTNDDVKKHMYCKLCLKVKNDNERKTKYCDKCPAIDILNSLHIQSPEETLDEIIYKKKSIARFGDGEMGLIYDLPLQFQKPNPELSKRLYEVLNSHEEGLIIGISNSFRIGHIDDQKKGIKHYWNSWINENKYELVNYLDWNRKYGSANISRFYMTYKDTIDVPKYVKKLKMVWDKKDIVMIEGEKTRSGVGNDLFDNANSIQRIICPADDAFDVYNEIYNEAIKIEKNKQILISLGPTATVLAYDLYKAGYWAIDIGHADLEYEWYLRKATTKIRIENKDVSEVPHGNENIANVTDPTYYKQILVKISN